MKTKKLLIVLLTLVMVFAFAACGGDDETAAFEKHAIPYPEGYDTTTTGASSYDGGGDHFDGGYFVPLDVYNLESTDSLTVIPEFETYQQTTEYTCGPCSALMVLNHYDMYDEKKYDELSIAEMSDTSDETGVGPDGIAKFFEEIGWDVERSPEDGSATFSWDTSDTADQDFIKWVKKNLKAGTPIMVDWIDWSGHWQVIIGYDDMGTPDSFGDDVVILADPYDTSDNYQDGYYTYGAERFFYMWHESSSLTGEPAEQPFVIATPPEEE